MSKQAKDGKSSQTHNDIQKLTPTGLIRLLTKEPNDLRKKALLISFVFDRLAKKGVDSFLVGGEAVEMYTAGQFVTGDIDITVSDKPKAERLLLQLGFKRLGMIWVNDDLRIAVQIVASYPTRTEKVRKIEVDGLIIKVVGVEDLIVDRLVAAKYWRSNPKLDNEQATVLFLSFKKSLDLGYLKRRVMQEKVEDYFAEISKAIRV